MSMESLAIIVQRLSSSQRKILWVVFWTTPFPEKFTSPCREGTVLLLGSVIQCPFRLQDIIQRPVWELTCTSKRAAIPQQGDGSSSEPLARQPREPRAKHAGSRWIWLVQDIKEKDGIRPLLKTKSRPVFFPIFKKSFSLLHQTHMIIRTSQEPCTSTGFPQRDFYTDFCALYVVYFLNSRLSS